MSASDFILLEHAVSVAWVGFSRDGNRFTTIVCSADPDYADTILRQEFHSIPASRWNDAPTDFGESDAALVSSLRSTFTLDAAWPDRDVLWWFCVNGGRHAMEDRGAWAAEGGKSLTLPDDVRRH